MRGYVLLGKSASDVDLIRGLPQVERVSSKLILIIFLPLFKYINI